MNYSYHNTLNESGDTLARRENKAQFQGEKILEWFKMYEQSASPSKIWDYVFHKRVLLTSVRRALSNLTRDGELVKTEVKVRGAYGHPECCWSLAPKHNRKETYKPWGHNV